MAIAAASSRVRRACPSTRPAASTDVTLPPHRSIRTYPHGVPPCQAPLLAVAFLGFCAVAAPAAADRSRYKLDPNHTIVLASWNHFGFSNPVANFGQVDGSSCTTPPTSAASSVQVTLPLSGLTRSCRIQRTPEQRRLLRCRQVPDRHLQEHQGRGRRRRQAQGHRRSDHQRHDQAGGARRDAQQGSAMRRWPGAAVGFDATTTIKRSDFGLGDVRAERERRRHAAHHHRGDGAEAMPRRSRRRKAAAESTPTKEVSAAAMIIERPLQRVARFGRLARQPAHVLVRQLPRPAVDGLRPRCG